MLTEDQNAHVVQLAELVDEVDGDAVEAIEQQPQTQPKPIPRPASVPPQPRPAPKPVAVTKPAPKPSSSSDALAALDSKVQLEERLAILETQAKEQTARLSETSLNSAKSEILGNLGLLGDSVKNLALKDAVSAFLQRNLTFNTETMAVESIDNTSLDELTTKIVDTYKDDFLKLKRTSGARPNFARNTKQPTDLIAFHNQQRQLRQSQKRV